jgi:hypothetical protein
MVLPLPVLFTQPLVPQFDTRSFMSGECISEGHQKKTEPLYFILYKQRIHAACWSNCSCLLFQASGTSSYYHPCSLISYCCPLVSGTLQKHMLSPVFFNIILLSSCSRDLCHQAWTCSVAYNWSCSRELCYEKCSVLRLWFAFGWM